jgi:hypothetical protein
MSEPLAAGGSAVSPVLRSGNDISVDTDVGPATWIKRNSGLLPYRWASAPKNVNQACRYGSLQGSGNGRGSMF